MTDDARKLDKEVRTLREQSDALLLNILPAPIAERLKASSALIADRFEAVSVLFADIVGFTSLSATITADHLVRILDGIFTEYDRLADVHGLEKIKTIGDAYMVAAGLPIPQVDHAARIARMALDMLTALEQLNREHGTSLQVRIGIHSGPVVAGGMGRRQLK